MQDIHLVVARAIKENRWLSIIYKNADERITYFWIAIQDIDPQSKKIIADVVNYTLSMDVKNNYILLFDRIQKATIIEGTIYTSKHDLLQKIDSNPIQFEWLHYYESDVSILEYYRACLREDVELEEKNYEHLAGFDERQFIDGRYTVSCEQMPQIMRIIKKNEKVDEEHGSVERLSMNLAAIYTKQEKHIPLFYQDLRFDVEMQQLVMLPTIRYNAMFRSEKFSFHLKSNINFDLEQLSGLFETDRKAAYDIISDSLRSGDRLDTVPYIAVYKKIANFNYDREFEEITTQYHTNKLSKPLSAFFGRLSVLKRSATREVPVFLIDEKINIDQLRAIYNSVNQTITYVQGPPGTGKTTLIINSIISSLINEKTMLITSNNNEAIDAIYNKLTNYKYHNMEIPFTILRLGNIERVKQALATIQRYYKMASSQRVLVKQLTEIKAKITSSVEKINSILEKYERKLSIEEQIEDLQNLLKISENDFLSLRIQPEIDRLSEEYKSYKNLEERDIIRNVVVKRDMLEQYLFYSSVRNLQSLNKPEYQKLKEIIISPEGDSQHQAFNQFLSDASNLQLLQEIFPIIITTNISASRLGPPTPSFDLMIMDEAGQCSVATSIIPMARANRALFVGDHRQLQPVILLDAGINKQLRKEYDVSDTYDYVKNSILRVMKRIDQKSLYILLRQHYRCAKKIIQFSNRKYYDQKLIIKDDNLDDALRITKVHNVTKPNTTNVAEAEINEIIRSIKANKSHDVGVITPFRNQADSLKQALDENDLNYVKVGTVHTFQGGEKEIIYFSPAITMQTKQKTYDWVKNNEELINVAITRAKKELHLVCDPDAIIKLSSNDTDDLTELMDYVRTNGKYELAPLSGNYYKSVASAKTIDTQAERNLFTTLTQLLSVERGLHIERKMKITDCLVIDKSYPHFRYANSAHFDIALLNQEDKIVVAIEIDGEEHYSKDDTKARDQIKNQIAQDNNLKIYRILNEDVKRYDLLLTLITTNLV